MYRPAIMDDGHAILRRLAGLPLGTRRRVLRGVRSVQGLVRPGAGPVLAPVLKRALRLGDREAARLDRAIAFHDALTALEWGALLVRTKAQLVADARRVEIADDGVLARVAASGKPVILAPLHMGNYVFGMAVAMNAHFAGRPMLILRAREDSEADTRVMERIAEIGTEMRFLQVSDKASYIDAVRFVRGGAVVIYFVDLPPSYGGPVDVTLFGHPLRLALGIDALARVAGATVVPLAVTSSLTGDRVAVGRPFEVVDPGQAERMRVARLVARHVETAILRDPGQWHFWPRLGEFAPLAEDARAPQEATA